jgi:hypothetical protein
MKRLGIAILLAVGSAPAAAQPAAPCGSASWPLVRQLAGSWVAQGTSRGDSGRDEASHGRAEIEVRPASCMVVEQLDGRVGARRQFFFYAMSFAGQRAQRVYYDSAHAQFLLFMQETGDTGMLRFERRQEMNARTLVSRTDIRLTSPRTFRLEHFLSVDGGHTWARVQAWTYRRTR